MKGTVKQIAYAKDIMSNPIKEVSRYIAWAESLSEQIAEKQAEIQPLRKAICMYSRALKGRPEFNDAAFVIEHKRFFSHTMISCVRKAVEESNLQHSCLVSSISRSLYYI